MNENDYKSLIIVYQQKSNDFLSQLIAAEAKLLISNQTVDTLKKKISEQESELSKLMNKKKPQQKTVLDSEEF